MSRQSIVTIAIIIVAVAFVFNAGTVGYWTFMAIFAYFAARLIYSIIKSFRYHRKKRNASGREYIVKMTARLMGLFFISGTIIYTVTFSVIGDIGNVRFSNAELIVRSLICSLDMFMLDVDSNILDRLNDYPFLRGMIIIQGAMSFVCTLALLASLVFSRAKAYYILHKKTKITSTKNHLYLFFGINDNSMLLAKDIHAHDAKAVTVLIEGANVADDDSDSWDSIVRLFTHRRKTFDYAEDAHALVAIASRQLYDMDGEMIAGDNEDVMSMIGLDKIGTFIGALSHCNDDPQLHVFFLSDNEDNNILSLINLAKDKSVLDIAADKRVAHRIYCHARYNGPNKVVEDLAVRKGLEVEIVDSSHLAVELLKSRDNEQPVRVASLSEEYPATVAGPINSLIVGFGEVGRDAFRFLYEFGTFIGMNGDNAEEVTPRITAVDRKMDILDGIFEANTPDISYNDGNIALRQLDCRSVEFYDKILSPENCSKLNYVVLALGDDDDNITLATNIFNRIRRYRGDMSRLIIMVRCNRYEKLEIMQKIADHYNKGCGGGDINVIRLFGNPKEIYSYDTIIRDALTKRGIAFMENYQRLCKENDTWKGRREKLTGVADKKAGEIIYPDIDKLRKLRRQESQDLANALHVATKMWLLRQALGRDYDWEGFMSRLFDADGNPVKTGKMENIRYPYLTPAENEIMLNLAMLEHARWNSAHRLLGYRPNDESPACDERTRRHNCLRPWSALDDQSFKASIPDWPCDYKSYDYSVVETSIALVKN